MHAASCVPQKALDVYQTLSSFWGWGLGKRLVLSNSQQVLVCCSILNPRCMHADLACTLVLLLRNCILSITTLVLLGFTNYTTCTTIVSILLLQGTSHLHQILFTYNLILCVCLFVCVCAAFPTFQSHDLDGLLVVP